MRFFYCFPTFIIVFFSIGEQLKESFRTDVNRFQKLPAINDNGFKLSESVAIFHYLGRKGLIPERYYPKNDIKKLTKIDEYLEWQQTGLFFSAGSLFFLQRALVTPPPPEVIAKLTKSLIECLEVLEHRWLSNTKFLTSDDEITFADLSAVVNIEQLLGTKLYQIDDVKYPRINQWMIEVRNYFGDDFREAHNYVYKYGERYGKN